MTWRLAKTLDTLRKQVNEKYPERSKASDGTIGNAEHSARASDHNPDDDGVVKAVDLTHDPLHGLDSEHFAEALLRSRDKRIKYVISNRKIASGEAGPHPWEWRPYTGKNPHNHHVHLSVRKEARYFDDISPWQLDHIVAASVAPENMPHKAPREALKRGSTGETVKELQRKLGLMDGNVDGVFGPRTETAVREKQKKLGLVADGVVGPHTWEML